MPFMPPRPPPPILGMPAGIDFGMAGAGLRICDGGAGVRAAGLVGGGGGLKFGRCVDLPFGAAAGRAAVGLALLRDRGVVPRKSCSFLLQFELLISNERGELSKVRTLERLFTIPQV